MPLPALPASLVFTASDTLVATIAVTSSGTPVTLYHDPALQLASASPGLKSQDGGNISKTYWLPAGTYSVVVTIGGAAQGTVSAVLAAGGSQTVQVVAPVAQFSVATTTTLTVAPSNSTSAANYYCQGTSSTGGDEVTIAAAIAALPSKGGRILLLAGQFWRTNPIVCDSDNVSVDGENRFATIISPASNAVGAADMIVGFGRLPNGVEVRSMQYFDASTGTTPLASSACGLIFGATSGVTEDLWSKATALDGFRYQGYKTVTSSVGALTVAVATTPAIGTTETWTMGSTAGLTVAGSYLAYPPTGTDYLPEWVTCNSITNGTTAVFARAQGTTAAKTHAIGTTLNPFTVAQIFDVTVSNVEAAFSNRDGIVLDPYFFNSELVLCRVEGGSTALGKITRNGIWCAGAGVQLIGCHPYFCSTAGLYAYSTLPVGAQLYVIGGEYESSPIGISAQACQYLSIGSNLHFFNNSVNDVNSASAQRLIMGDFITDSPVSAAHIFVSGAAKQYVDIHDFEITLGSAQGIEIVTGATASGIAYRGHIHHGSIEGVGAQGVVLKDVSTCKVDHVISSGTLLETVTTTGNSDYNTFDNNTLIGAAVVTTVGTHSTSTNNVTGAP